MYIYVHCTYFLTKILKFMFVFVDVVEKYTEWKKRIYLIYSLKLKSSSYMRKVFVQKSLKRCFTLEKHN